jgi:DNA-directed RNA polymerase sigma subunit (sigma70/sigma32)
MPDDPIDYSDDPVKVYLREVANVTPLTSEQERECIRHIREGDDQADWSTKELVERVLPLVVAIAQRHPTDRIHILDLIRAGIDALINAARAFADSTVDNLADFATPFIERAIEHAVESKQD